MTQSLYAVAATVDRSSRNYLHQWRGADKAVFASPGCVTLRGTGWAVAGVGMVSADRRDVRLFCQCPLALSEEGRCLL